jgi:hypothetical protein
MTTLSNTPAETVRLRVGQSAEPAQVEIVRRVDFETVFSGLLLVFGLAWGAMLLVGSLHSRHPVVPLISYWDALCVLFLLDIGGQAVRQTQRVWSRKKDRW